MHNQTAAWRGGGSSLTIWAGKYIIGTKHLSPGKFVWILGRCHMTPCHFTQLGSCRYPQGDCHLPLTMSDHYSSLIQVTLNRCWNVGLIMSGAVVFQTSYPFHIVLCDKELQHLAKPSICAKLFHQGSLESAQRSFVTAYCRSTVSSKKAGLALPVFSWRKQALKASRKLTQQYRYIKKPDSMDSHGTCTALV